MKTNLTPTQTTTGQIGIGGVIVLLTTMDDLTSLHKLVGIIVCVVAMAFVNWVAHRSEPPPNPQPKPKR